MKSFYVWGIVLALAVSVQGSTTILSDDFESYASTSAMTEVWSVMGGPNVYSYAPVAHSGENFVAIESNGQCIYRALPQEVGDGETAIFTAYVYIDDWSDGAAKTSIRFQAWAHELNWETWHNAYSADAMITLNTDSSMAVTALSWNKVTLVIMPDSVNGGTYEIYLNDVYKDTQSFPEVCKYDPVRYINIGSLGTPCDAGLVDDVSVSIVPEPATIFLVSISGFLFRTFRRRA